MFGIDIIIEVFVAYFTYKTIKKRILSSYDTESLQTFINSLNIENLILIKYTKKHKHIIFDNKEQTLHIPESLSQSTNTFYRYMVLSKLFGLKNRSFIYRIKETILKNIHWINYCSLILFVPSLIMYDLPYYFYIIYFIFIILMVLLLFINSILFWKKLESFSSEKIKESNLDKLRLFVADNLSFLLFLLSIGYVVSFLVQIFKSSDNEYEN